MANAIEQNRECALLATIVIAVEQTKVAFLLINLVIAMTVGSEWQELIE